MPYNASLHTTTNKPLGVAQGVSTDGRSQYYDSSLFKYRDYISKAEVMAYLDTATIRKGNFPVFINETGTLVNGEITGGATVEHWFKNGTNIENLVPKLNPEYVPNETLQSTTARGKSTDKGILINTVDTTTNFIPLDVRGRSANSRLLRVGDEGGLDKFYVSSSFVASTIKFVATNGLAINGDLQNDANNTASIALRYNIPSGGNTSDPGGNVSVTDSFSGTQVLNITRSGIKTLAPSNNGAGVWKLGKPVTGGVEVQIDGSNYILTTPGTINAIKQVYAAVGGGSAKTVQVDALTDILIVSPLDPISILTINLPLVPRDGVLLTILFGGDLSSGDVARQLYIVPPSGVEIIQINEPVSTIVGDVLQYRYISEFNKYFRIL